MKVEILLFGPQASLAQTDRVWVHLDPDTATVDHAMDALRKAMPVLAPTLNASRLAVNHAYAEQKQLLQASDEVALIGMVSGG